MTNVLVVDDDFMVAKLHCRYVSAVEGFTVSGVAHSGAEALRAAELCPDLVLLDVFLPDMDGIRVLRELRAAGLGMDALFITAARDVGTIRSALRAGALHYRIKPFSQAALHEQLRHVASLRTRLDDLDEARQEDVDQIFGTRPRGSRELPRASRPHGRPGRLDPPRPSGGPLGDGVRGGRRPVPGERPPLSGVLRPDGPRGDHPPVRRDGAARAALPWRLG
ncbi:Protein-glutamate methylesterase/protein-glutamine glutaminase [Streptomyces narbonensis]